MRVLLLTASTGGGHDMRADAFERWAEALTDWETRIHRPLEQGHGIYRLGVQTYNTIQRFAPVLHHGYFNLLELAGLHRRPEWILGARRFLETIDEYRPDVIVSTHAHLNHGFFALARRHLGDGRVRCVTYCGELGGGYGFSRHWVSPQSDLFIGAVDETASAALRLGMPPTKVCVGGFLLRPEFYERRMTEAQRRRYVGDELGLDPDRFILLLATGAVGANNHLSVLRALERHGVPIQAAVVCGRSERTFASVERWARAAISVRAKAMRYRDDMASLLQCVSAVFARPGTGTTSEAVLTGCPMIMNGIGGYMPQESITVRHGLRHGFACRVSRARDLAGLLDSWTRRPDELQTIRSRLASLRPAQHPRDILERATGCGITTDRRGGVQPAASGRARE